MKFFVQTNFIKTVREAFLAKLMAKIESKYLFKNTNQQKFNCLQTMIHYFVRMPMNERALKIT